MSWRVMRRLLDVGRVLKKHRVLHLMVALLPSDTATVRLMRKMLPHRLSASNHAEDAAQLRMALQTLGPIFIKVGQILSTRPDLLPPEYIYELAHLQDRVTPVDSAQIRVEIEAQLSATIDELFSHFDDEPVASASVAQVHRAVVRTGKWAGRDVAVKVLRPNIDVLIKTDVECLHFLARQFARFHPDGTRLRPVEVIGEVERHLQQELDLQCEAANASQLRHHFAGNPILAVPEMCWDYCARRVMVQEWMTGVPISHLNVLEDYNINLKRLARDGVEIFFTQVFRDGFFHADMHPGNIFVGTRGEYMGRYIALDCGIVGTLSEFDRHYLAVNFLAFFNRDYRAVAAAHIESGWVPPDTPLEGLTSAVRTTCEPYFGRPIDEISLGQVLMRLFDVSRQYKVSVQPQLVLLQKTMLNVEGMGRLLDPKLDLWDTAKPYLEKWMKDTLGPRGLLKRMRREWPSIVRLLPAAPVQILTRLQDASKVSQLTLQLNRLEHQYLTTQKTNKRWRIVGMLSICILLILTFVVLRII
ncbi:ubiquinone biosynthesis regulatory protein kinase UbiB [Hydromonas duriensis]|uniref:2-octaprenylphenol hydroxylase n=1 Tax=Hydromonas duriensis TaxID=1527608 RepID=A0A4R6Y7S3_9BURK|nr:ubiquinone biosynthesis regulatory protein kinase UbiB [Hydromonas duriensis]TDR31402.1 2-octaprenylphenol hydroxylase [Hydromonas duriensis]